MRWLRKASLGKTDANGRKIDPKLSTPQTIRSKNSDLNGEYNQRDPDKTRDDRTLRIQDEDPELRADDTVLIDLTPVRDFMRESAEQSKNRVNNSNYGQDNGVSGTLAGATNNGLDNAVNGNNSAANNGSNNGFNRNNGPDDFRRAVGIRPRKAQPRLSLSRTGKNRIGCVS